MRESLVAVLFPIIRKQWNVPFLLLYTEFMYQSPEKGSGTAVQSCRVEIKYPVLHCQPSKAFELASSSARADADLPGPTEESLAWGNGIRSDHF